MVEPVLYKTKGAYMSAKIAIFFIVITFAVNIYAETKFPLTVSIGGADQLGYKTPDISFNAGVERIKENYWFDIVGKFNPTDKRYYGDVTQTSATGEIFWKKKSGFFLGGGGMLRNITFHDLGSNQSYWTGGPIIGGGWMKSNLRVTVRGRPFEYDRRYDFYGVSWSLFFDLKKKIRIGVEQGFYRAKSKGGGEPFNAFVSGVILGYIF